ncbi:MAG: hypothetical protein ACOC2W_01175 [bacterium]
MGKVNESHMDMIKYRMGYVINETPKYRPLVGDNEEYDDIPSISNDIEEQEENAPEPEEDEINTGEENELANDDEEDIDAPSPEFADDELGDDVASPEPEEDVNQLQNDVIKHNIETMKTLHQEIETLNNTVQGLNSKMEELNSDVEEVREPTDAEKLMSKSETSYPYYFNLNDLWSKNWFQENRKKEDSNAIKELPDGTYIADFDDLPSNSGLDIQNSFNDIV